MKTYVSLLILSSLFFFASCGSDKTNKKPPGEISSNSITANQTIAQQCGCTTEIKKVCGANGQTYENECIMKCFNISLKHYLSCELSDNVCYNGVTRVESEIFPLLEAQFKHKTLLTYPACGEKQM